MAGDEFGDTEHPSGTVTFVNRFTVSVAPAEFERVFAETSRFMAHQDGYLGNTLLRHMDREHSYVNIARWRDAGCFRKAVAHPAFAPHAAALRAISTSEPNLYTAAHTFPARREDAS
jgi:monooxygenase